MVKITMQAAAKEVRNIAKDCGLTFKRQPKQGNGRVLFHFVDRSTHKVFAEDMTFWNAYENCMSGYIQSLTK